jgi:hypothetical protein
MLNVNVISVSDSENEVGCAPEVILHGLAITTDVRQSVRNMTVLIALCL